MYDHLGRDGMDRMEQEGGGPGGASGFGGFGGYGFGGGAGGAPFSAQDIFEQFFRNDPGFGSFFSGNMFVESSMRLSFMVSQCDAAASVWSLNHVWIVDCWCGCTSMENQHVLDLRVDLGCCCCCCCCCCCTFAWPVACWLI
jgi:hypothetical protein